MVNIFFNVEEARNYLMEHGEVYSLRWKRHTGRARVLKGSYYKHEDLGFATVELVKMAPTIKDLLKHVDKSGFENVTLWILAAREHYKKYGVLSLEELGLYKVILIKPIEVAT
jgi:hypothetical protein